MDGSEKIILDISSDEEVGWGEGGLPSSTDGDAGGRDYDWLSELLAEYEGKVDNYSTKAVDAFLNKGVDDSLNNVVDDSDGAVVVEENLPSKKRKVEKPFAEWESRVDDNDDDCVVLDGDPDKPVEVNNGGEHDDSDELLLVSEKGQVACRDYPHPRHLCVKFAFSSSPHETHCDQCHCYVCDLLAPCLHWGTGISSIDHCHASDKDEFWKSQRKISKNGGIISQSVVPNSTDTSLFVGPTDTYSVNNVLNFRQAVRPPGYRAEISTTNNFITRHNMMLSKCNARSRYQPRLVSQHLPSFGNGNPRPIGHLIMPNNLNHYNVPRNSHLLPATRWPGRRCPVMPSLHVGPSLSNMGSGLVTPHASPHHQVSPRAQWSSKNYVPYMAIQCQTGLQSNTAEFFQNPPIPCQHHMPPYSDNYPLSSLSNATQVSQNPHHLLPYPVNVHSFSSLLESQVHNQLHSLSKEGNETEIGGGSSSAEIVTGWNSHINETNKNIAAATVDLQMLAAEATELDFDDWTLGLDSFDIPLSLQPNNIQSPGSSSHINGSNPL